MNKVIDAPQGEKITMDGNDLNVPNKPIIPFIAVSYTHLTLPTKA